MFEKLISTGAPPVHGLNQIPFENVSTAPLVFLLEIAGLIKKLSI
jgi:hypothetical protein